MSTETRTRRQTAPPRRPTRRRARLRRRVAVLAVLTVLVLAVLLGSSLLSVRAVDVTGTGRLTADQVRTAAAITPGGSMLGVDTDAAAKRVATLGPVASVTVSRSWPGTVEIAVTERIPVAWARDPDGSLLLVDGQGVPFASTPTPPRNTVEVRATPLAPGSPTVAAALAVYRTLAAPLRARTTAVAANSPGDVQLVLRGGATVKWGDPTRADRKNAVVVALLTRKGTTYDVAAPDMPTVR